MPVFQCSVRKIAATLSLLFAISAVGNAQRITRPIDSRQRTTFSGHVHSNARPDNDLGRVSPSMKMSYVTLVLAQTASQQADLDKLLLEQQTPGSPNYRHWLTPEEYAQRFGVSEEDLAKISSWLQAEGLTIASIARGRNSIAVNGDAGRIESAFQTEIHHYAVNGETHFANSTDPSLPAAFAGLVRTIRGLHDFRAKPASHAMRQTPADATSQKPAFTTASGHHNIAPDDLATIYNIAPLYAAGFNGSGQTLVIAGQTRINLSDIQQFRANYNLPANDPQVILIPNAVDPGIQTSDVAEADLDLEWSGAVARNAQILYVYAPDVMQAVQYAIDQNLAPVVSISYGLCELEQSPVEALAFRSWAQQGNSQGITWFAASGDTGGADCNSSRNNGLAVDLPASVPEVTGLGGTEFIGGAGQYWNSTNTPNLASALSYIPETAWNDSVLDGEPAATGGGASVLFGQPSWQSGSAPADNARHVPDVSLAASADHDGYLVYTGGLLQVYGGTSVPAPAFAGIATLLNHYLASNGSAPGLGNMNPKLYSLAKTAPDVFHDVTSGDNVVTVRCPSRSRTCTAAPVGFVAGVGYDSVTGLGSVDAARLVARWNGGDTLIPLPDVSISLQSNISSLASSDVAFLIATATSSLGITPSGTIQFAIGGTPLGSAPLVGSAGSATATLAVFGSQLPLGSGTITASYSAGTSNAITASVAMSVRATGPGSSLPVVQGLTNAASFRQVYAPGMIMSIFGSQLAPASDSAHTIPLPNSINGVAVTINGVTAPLYYASSTLLNVQIPYETPVNSSVTLTVNNNGRVASQTFAIGSAAPGIFTDQNLSVVPNTTAARGQTVTLYITGAGTVLPPVPTGGTSPSGTPTTSLPKPSQDLTVTVGGLKAATPFFGIPSGLAGVLQINYQVPATAPLGSNAVVVSVGGVPSAAANLNVTP